MSNPLPNKYRPKTLKQVIGNEATVRSIMTMLARDQQDLPSAIILHGPSGCGKTTLARIIGKKLCENETDLIELNISDTRGIDSARSIIQTTNLTSLSGGYTVVVLNECHQATKDFQNAMLEVLEEPPAKVCFILCTTEPNALLRTILTRSTRLGVRTLAYPELESIAKRVCKREKIRLKPMHMRKLITAADGTPRQLLVTLNAIKGMPREDIDEYIQAAYPPEDPKTLELCQALIQQRGYKEVMLLAKSIDNPAEDTRRAIIGYMSKVLLSKPNPIAAKIIDNLFDPLWNVGKPGLIFCLYNIMKGE